jgi:hypothetical protein
MQVLSLIAPQQPMKAMMKTTTPRTIIAIDEPVRV